ncbi:hypothetical protein AURANDRAFT_67902 [Aureococcus anophagefferens]|uniref:F-box domain-containing protein n=1 Tax=Aureococcus anophagefferens TaxID=44056 RepID=F0YMT2_AURAN|nr:hypothetical protein AURANDRAFT_67902 [Aureococcus anophagefferens]EGB03564.1 hypothetical protein AURANDRAFT_67902 [Aureococcus anophagefferens]|eukprot:XP_009041714.1 hypothetical protein AURANDRAFT_67902 [Aureococcus anophagefferens]
MRPLVELCTRCIADSLLEEDAWIEGDEHAWLRSLPTEIREGLLAALRGRASPRLLSKIVASDLRRVVVGLREEDKEHGWDGVASLAPPASLELRGFRGAVGVEQIEAATDRLLGAGLTELDLCDSQIKWCSFLHIAGCSTLRTLRLGWIGVGVGAVFQIAASRARLAELDLSGAAITFSSVDAVVEAFGASLERLSLRSCGDISKDSSAGLEPLPKLTHLDVGMTNLSSEAIDALLEGRGGQFRHVDVSECGGVDRQTIEDAFGSLDFKPGTAALASMPETLDLTRHLRVVCLSRCPGIGDETLRTLAAESPRLERLEVDWSAASDGGVRAVLESCPLQCLNVAGCKALTDAVVDLAAASPTLTYLDLTFCDCADVSEALSRRLPDRVLVVDYYNEQYRAGELHEGRRHSTLPDTPWDLMRLPCDVDG